MAWDGTGVGKSTHHRWLAQREAELLELCIAHSGVEHTIGRVNRQPFCQWQTSLFAQAISQLLTRALGVIYQIVSVV